jgi:PKD repeat protein
MAVAEYTCNEPTVSIGSEQDGVTADFSASETTIGIGNSVVFTDLSEGGPTSWSWSFETSSGTWVTSTNQNPVITYNTTGTYDVFDVLLTATNNCTSSDLETKTDYITVRAYCTPSASSAHEYISRVQINNDIDNSTGLTTGGYADYTNLSANVLQGATNIPLSVGIVDRYSFDDISIWVDWNKDGDFNDSGEDIICDNAINNSNSYSFDVPLNALVGSTRMRIRLKWDGSSCQTNGACGSTSYGESEDYTVNICKNPDIPTLSFAANPICSGDDVALLISGNLNSATQWVVYTGSCGGTQIGATTTSSYTLSNVTSTTTYYVRGEGSCITAGSCGSVSLTVNPLPTAAISGSTTICEGQSTNLSVALTGSQPWSIIYTDGITPVTVQNITSSPYTFTVSPTTTTTYTLTEVEDKNCITTSFLTGSATVTVDPTSVGGTATAASSTICPNSGTIISLAGYTGSIQWQQSANGTTGWADVTGGSGSTTDSYTTANLTTTTYYRAEVTSGLCSSDYSNTVQITVEDNTPPTFTCPSAVTVNLDASCQLTIPDLITGITDEADNCGTPTMSQSPAAGTVVASGHGTTHNVTITADDGNGNTTTCNVTVTGNDATDPTITCPANVTVTPDDANNGCTASNGNVSLGDPSRSDNCHVASVTNNAPATYSMGNTTVTWIVTDDAGNTANCNQTVTVQPTNVIDIRIEDLGNSCQSGETGTQTQLTWDVTLVTGTNSWTYDYTINDGTSNVATGTNVSASGNIQISYTMNNTTATDITYTLTLTNVKDNCSVSETNTANNSDAAIMYGVPNTSNITTN